MDRWFVEPGCGEVRLTYRLALTNPGRPGTRLPMTVNFIFRTPSSAPAATPDWEPPPRPPDACRRFAQAWLSLPAGGRARADALAAMIKGASPLARVEVNLQNVHGPSYRLDEDDHAEYLLRAFDVTDAGRTAAARTLVDTPRADLTREERRQLRAWILDHFDAIDAGAFVLPQRFLAARAVSVTPRGLARPRNRPFRALFGEDAEAMHAFARLPYSRAKAVRSPAALLRRLDQSTCQGCHESRSIAGFHLLGEERDDLTAFNALLQGSSAHAHDELPWREQLVRATAEQRADVPPRPFADRGVWTGYGAHCGLGDPGFAGWTCAPGLECRDLYAEEVGQCVPTQANFDGDACQDARISPNGEAPDGDRMIAKEPRACTSIVDPNGAPPACSPNAYGFPGGFCIEGCRDLGAIAAGGHICVDLPVSGYEADCFDTEQPIEECIKGHLTRAWARACDTTAPCRDDFACARVVPEATTGACIPPYFLFQVRVDGPARDR